MMNRRDFSAAAGALSVLGASSIAMAQGKRVFRVANPTGAVDAAQLSNITCGRHPRLRYYETEGIDLDFVSMSSITQAMLSVVTGRADLAPLVPTVFLPALAKEPGLGLVAAYNWLPGNANVVVVNADSPIRSISDLAGKRIGIRNQGDGGVLQFQLMLTELGLPTSDINFIAIGDQGVAGTALSQGKVDAFVTFDTAAGRIEALGFPLRYLPLPPDYGRLTVSAYGFRKKAIKEDRKNVVGFCRAVAKSTLFAYTNLAQAINIHWSLYPDSRPKSKSEEESRQEILIILKQRRNNWIRRADAPDQRWGASSLDEWKSIIEIAARSSKNPALPQQIGAPRDVFTNDLIDEVNQFDKADVIRQAKAFRI